MMSTQLQPKIYEKAAARILKGQNLYCCCAIDEVQDLIDAEDEGEHKEAFLELFHHDFKVSGCLWAASPSPDSQKARVIALLLMAEIAKDC